MRILGWLFCLLALAGGLHAALNGPELQAPASVAPGQDFTVALSVSNGESYTATVSADLGANTFAVLGGPWPLSATVSSGASASFTWTFSGSGCGAQTISAWASAPLPAGGLEDSGTVSATVQVLCTPSPTPPPTRTPAAELGSALILGNVFHPLQGGQMTLQFTEPYASTVTVTLYDRLGRQVKGFSMSVGPGTQAISWDGRGDDGSYVASGIYEASFSGRGLNSLVKFAVIK
jgi:hypothetical protein